MRSVTVVALGLLCLGCGGRAMQMKSDAGCAASSLDACEYEVGSAALTSQTVMVTEPISGRVLPVLVRKPAGTGPFPVVLWSHGGAFDDDGQKLSAEWGETFAHHGFVAMNIGHVSVNQSAGLALCAEGKVPMGECVAAADEDSNGFIALVKSRDVIAVLDALPTMQVGVTLDLTRVAVTGWSAGARAPQVMQGARFVPSASAVPYSAPHARVKAIIGLSPISPGYGGFFEGAMGTSWDQLRGPVLMVTGTNDVKPSKPDLKGADRRIAWDRQQADGRRWLLYSNLPEGVGEHGTYNLGDLGSSDARLSRLSRAIRSVALAFLDAELNGDVDARAWLATTNARTLAGDASWEHK